MKTVTSKDGTKIAFDQIGSGRLIILVDSALADRTICAKLAKLLSEEFTVINYDRRGRGDSKDTQPYAVGREVEDIEALIDGAGGSGFIFGSSSGAVLALEAASKLPAKVRKQILYEPPFIVDDSRPPMPEGFLEQVKKSLAEDKRSNALKLFFSTAMGIPNIFIFIMSLMPSWSKSKAVAHTLPYDLAVMGDTQQGQALSKSRWATANMPTLVLTGGKSEAFFHKAGDALAEVLPNAEHKILKDQHHGSAVMSPNVIASEMIEFFKGK
ncbi:MAG: alpha/beta hydrolase [Anaerolineales bacterium]|nr:alpha/beta hydrolase [Anaerolineales bacterium]